MNYPRFLLFFFAMGVSIPALANPTPNFSCKLFSGVSRLGGSSVSGSLILTGEDPMNQSYELTVAEGNQDPKTFTGKLEIKGFTLFTSLDREVQEGIQRAIQHRAGAKTGNLFWLANAGESSTLNIFLMPEGEIAYLTIGVLEALCM